MPAGRPSKYKPEYCDMIIDHMAQGLSKESFAAIVEVHKETIYGWAQANPEFSDAIKIGEAKSRIFWEKLGMGGTAGKVGGFNAASWIFNMKNRFHEEWRDRQSHEITGKDGGAIETKSKVLQVVSADSPELVEKFRRK